jgi:antitoxin CcdA
MNRTDDRPQKVRKKSVNLSIPVDIVQAARDLGINVSAAATVGLAAAVKRRQEEEWLEVNRAGLEAYDRMIEEEGLPIPPTWLLNPQEFEDRHGSI